MKTVIFSPGTTNTSGLNPGVYCMAVLLATLISGCADAARGTPQRTLAFQHLAVAVPEGWVRLRDDRTVETRVIEFAPIPREMGEWQQLFSVTVTKRRGVKDELQKQLEAVVSHVDESCVSARSEMFIPDHFNAYQFLTYCGRVRDASPSGGLSAAKGIISSYHVIEGPNAIFLIRFAWQTEAFDAKTIDLKESSRVQFAEFEAGRGRVTAMTTCGHYTTLKGTPTREEGRLWCEANAASSAPRLGELLENGDELFIVGDDGI